MPPLSEFETLVMGIFVPAHTPPNPPPQDLFLLGSHISLKLQLLYKCHCLISKGIKLFCVYTKLGLILKQTGDYIFCE